MRIILDKGDYYFDNKGNHYVADFGEGKEKIIMSMKCEELLDQLKLRLGSHLGEWLVRNGVEIPIQDNQRVAIELLKRNNYKIFKVVD